MNNKKCYGSFQLWVLNNFPFTIDDWDSTTQYQMLCKCLGALKEQLDVNSDLYKKITDLENYLDNLDLQDEVNNKIDEMVESGQLQEIITEYLQINGVLAFNTVSDMKLATNLIDGSICRTLGFHTINDGGGCLYKVREVTNEDVVNEMDIIALSDNQLIAELIGLNYNVKCLGAYGDNSHDDTLAIQYTLDKYKKAIIPKGTFLISQLKLDSGYNLSGTSYDLSCLKSISNNNITTGLITRKNDTTGWKMFIKNIKIDGNKSNNSNIFSGIYFKSTYPTDLNSSIIDVNVEKFSGNGITLINTSEVKLINTKCDENNSNGFDLQTSDCYLTNCCSNHNIERGFYIQYNSNKLIGCKAYFNGYGDNTTQDELLDGLKRYAGIEIKGGNNNAIIGCEFQDNCGAGIYLNYTSRNQIQGCLLESNGLLLDENGQVISYTTAGLEPYIPQIEIINGGYNMITSSCGNFRYANIGYTAKWSLYIKDTTNSEINILSRNDENTIYNSNSDLNNITINSYKIKSVYEDITSNVTQERAGIIERLKVFKKDNIVSVYFQLNPDVTIPASDTTLLFSGLPAPTNYLYLFGENTGNGKCIRLSLGTNGRLSTWYDSEVAHGNFLVCAFSYITNE